jgi:hypothetical protein
VIRMVTFMAVIIAPTTSCHEWQECHGAMIFCQLCVMLVP